MDIDFRLQVLHSFSMPINSPSLRFAISNLSTSTYVCFHLSRSRKATATCRKFVTRLITTTTKTAVYLDQGSSPYRTSFSLCSSLRVHFLHEALQVDLNGSTLQPFLQARNLLFTWQSLNFPTADLPHCHMWHWLDVIYDSTTLLSKCGLAFAPFHLQNFRFQ